jgi:hypothetical protein
VLGGFVPTFEIVKHTEMLYVAIGILGATVWGTSAIVNPGVRWAHNLANGTQIVPGVSVPVDTKAPSGDRWSAFLYLSIEHPFGRAHE